MTLRSSCDSIKTPMEFDRCSHAIFYFFSKYLKIFNYKIKKIQADGCMLNVIVFYLCSGRQNVYYKHQYSKTYTLRSDLNRLQVYVTGIKEKQIFKRIQVANMSTFWVRFLQIRSACGWMSDRCCGHFGSQRGSFQRNRHGSAICKKRSQKCGVATWILLNICFSLIPVTYM